MPAEDELLTISAFARRVGLTPSALRFYDDCGVLPPALVDDATGYRYYTAGQEQRGLLLRDLRAVNLPLASVRTVLDGPPADSAAILRNHVRDMADRAEATRQAAARILEGLPPAGDTCTVTLTGPELASAVRQVTPSAAPPDTPIHRPERPAEAGESAESGDDAGVVLSGVLLELDADEVSLVATDRYRLAVRRLRPSGFAGMARAVTVRADELAGLTAWFAAADEVSVEAADGVVRFDRAGEVRELPVLDAAFPAYRVIVDGLPRAERRVVVDRLALLAALDGRDGLVPLDVGADRVTVGQPEEAGKAGESGGAEAVELVAICTGDSVRIGFTPGLLAAALSDSVGPDVLLEIGPPWRPVVVRSADQGTFTTLVMPARLDA